MKKSHLVLSSLGLVLLVAALVLGLAPSTSPQLEAGSCQFDWWNAQEWGMASTCQGATNACYNRAYTAAENTCAAENRTLCSTGTFTPSACYLSGGQWKVDCYLQFKCSGGPDIPPW